jgi:AcrR family transcriptional regulator
MGIKERQERDREAVQRSILDAARDLFVAEGYQNVSIRKIAERIEYSPAAIYSYFPSKDDIFFALADEGFRLLCPGPEAMHAHDHLPPIERIREALWGFYQFSVAYPEYFSLMFVDRSVPRISREYERFAFAQEMKAHLVDEMRLCINDGLFPGVEEPHAALNTLITGLVGVAVLRLADRLAPGEDAHALARNVLDTTIAGLRSGVAVRRTHTDCPLDEPAARSTPASDSSRSSR